MYKLFSRFFVISLLLSVSSAVSAAWADADMIDIRAFSEQLGHYVAVNNFSNPDGCSSPGALLLMRDDSTNWKMVHSLLLTGFVSGFG